MHSYQPTMPASARVQAPMNSSSGSGRGGTSTPWEPQKTQAYHAARSAYPSGTTNPYSASSSSSSSSCNFNFNSSGGQGTIPAAPSFVDLPGVYGSGARCGTGSAGLYMGTGAACPPPAPVMMQAEERSVASLFGGLRSDYSGSGSGGGPDFPPAGTIAGHRSQHITPPAQCRAATPVATAHLTVPYARSSAAEERSHQAPSAEASARDPDSTPTPPMAGPVKPRYPIGKPDCARTLRSLDVQLILQVDTSSPAVRLKQIPLHMVEVYGS
jgi:hypothetical protein